MFELSDVQEVFPNVNGAEHLSKLFGKPHKAFSASGRKSVHNLWVLPGHILVSLDEGKRLLSFDLLPKPKPWPEIVTLIPRQEDKKRKDEKIAVFEVFCYSSNPLYAIIVLRNGEASIWKFTRPDYQWTYCSNIVLCHGKNSQVMSVCFSEKPGIIYWCERRTPTQCCVCKGVIQIKDDGLSMVDTSAILHNCRPVELFPVSYKGICLRPIGNIPPGMMLFWSQENCKLQICIWNIKDKFLHLKASSSDFQSIITDHISLWVTPDINDPSIVALCVHPVSQELLILESSADLYSLKLNNDGRLTRYLVCSINQSGILEFTQRKNYRMFAFQRYLGLVVPDGDVVIFELRTGMAVWMTDSLRSASPHVWISQSKFPRVGLWTLSGVWALKPSPVSKQAETIFKIATGKKNVFENNTLLTGSPKRRKISRDSTSQFESKTQSSESELVFTFGEEDKLSTAENTKNSLSPAEKPPSLTTATKTNVEGKALLLISKLLREWKVNDGLSRIVLEGCDTILNNQLDLSTEEDFKMLVNSFSNPCVSLALFHGDKKYERYLSQKIDDLLIKSKEDIDQEFNPYLIRLLEKYQRLGKSVNNWTDIDIEATSSPEQAFLSPKEEIIELLSNEMMPVHDIDLAFQCIYGSSPREFGRAVWEVISLCAEQDVSLNVQEQTSPDPIVGKVRKSLWEYTLRENTTIFEFICLALWKKSASLLPLFVQYASDALNIQQTDTIGRKSCLTLGEIAERALQVLSTELHRRGNTRNNDVKIYVDLILLTDRSEKELESCDIYLENGLYKEALGLLKKHADNSELHTRLFYKTFTTLVASKAIKDYAGELESLVPENFGLIELCHLLEGLSKDTDGTSDLFVSSQRTISFGDLMPLLKSLAERR